MKNLFISGIILFAFSLSAVFSAQAQMRDQLSKPSDYSGPIVKEKDPSDGANLGNLFNMKMSHSYSVNFASFGGQYQNINAYTNTMQFFFDEDFTGEVNISLLHSPFGQSNMYNFEEENPIDVALNARLNYQVNDRMSLHFGITKTPSSYGYGSAYGRYYNRSPFQFGPVFGR